MAELDLEVVRHALGVARKHGFAEVELALGDAAFHARLDPMPPSAARAIASETATEPALVDVKAPLVGYAREARVPLEVGQTVERGQVLAVIEALGLANDVESPAAGEVVEVLVVPGQPVEYGQVMARVKPQ
jgi:acetyl-CoA carboxylase biotin carboxyl carrier protein